MPCLSNVSRLVLISNGIDVESQTPLTPLLPRNGQDQLVSILTRLARVQLSDDGPLKGHWLTHPLGTLGWGTTIVLVTPQLDEDTLWLLHQTYRRGARGNCAGLCATDKFCRNTGTSATTGHQSTFDSLGTGPERIMSLAQETTPPDKQPLNRRKK